MPRVLPFVTALVLSPAAPLVAQRLETFPRFDAAAAFEQAPERVQVGHHGLVGFAVGAVAGGVVGVLAAGDSCGNSAPGTTCSPRTGDSFLIGAGIGAVLGFVVGRLIPKYASSPAP